MHQKVKSPGISPVKAIYCCSAAFNILKRNCETDMNELEYKAHTPETDKYMADVEVNDANCQRSSQQITEAGG